MFVVKILLLILFTHAVSVCTLTTPVSSPKIPLGEDSLRSVYRELNTAVVERIAATAYTNDRHCSDPHHLPVIPVDELLQSYAQESVSQRMQDALERGFCVVDTANSPHAGKLNGMWDAMERDLFHDTANSSSLLYESLQRDQAQTKAGGGYDYIHFSPEHSNNNNETTTFGMDSLEALGSAYELLSELSLAFVSKCIAQHHGNQDMTEQLVDDWMSLPASSFQRLARYRPVSTSSACRENLRPHCDWSLVTLIPISNVPGLEIYCHDRKGGGSCWTRPEEVIASGVVVLAGKWLEILTPSVLESTIHRVVVEQDSDAAPRWSAPYFFRLNGEKLLLDETRTPHVDPQWSLQRKLVEIQRHLLRK